MGNNLVAKNDHNRGGAHQDVKNDYNRQDGKAELIEALDDLILEDETSMTLLWRSFVDNATSIATKEYERSK